jgi:hypothetical protein
VFAKSFEHAAKENTVDAENVRKTKKSAENRSCSILGHCVPLASCNNFCPMLTFFGLRCQTIDEPVPQAKMPADAVQLRNHKMDIPER